MGALFCGVLMMFASGVVKGFCKLTGATPEGFDKFMDSMAEMQYDTRKGMIMRRRMIIVIPVAIVILSLISFLLIHLLFVLYGFLGSLGL
jgi:hypothetical protein